MLSFFPLGVLDEILNLIESVSEEFPSYSSKSIFHLQIIGVCYNITSPVTGKSTDLAFTFGKIVGLSLFDIDK